MLNIYVCVGSACHMKGSYDVINELQRIIDEKQLGEKVSVKAALCMGRCTEAVSVRLDDGETISLSGDNVKSSFENIIMKRLKEDKQG